VPNGDLTSSIRRCIQGETKKSSPLWYARPIAIVMKTNQLEETFHSRCARGEGWYLLSQPSHTKKIIYIVRQWCG